MPDRDEVEDRAGDAKGAGRILCVTSSFPRWEGDSTTPFILHLAQDLQELGWRIDVLAPHAPEAAFHETIGGVRVERFRYLWPAALETVCYQGGALINLRKDPTNMLKLPALVFCEWLGLYRRLRRRDYDLLHSHWILPQGFTGVLSAGPLGVPHVITAHGGDVFALSGRLPTHFKSYALGRADAVTANSSVTRNAILKIAPGLATVHRIAMGVSEVEPRRDEVSGLRALYRRGAGPLLVFVGRLVEEKGVEDLLRAVSLLTARLPDVTALIVGEGQDRAALQNLAAELGLHDRVAFAGWVAPEEIASYLAAGDVFVGPSRTSPEGWVEAQGLVFAEAMLAGTPVIATRVGGITEIVEHERTGLLVRERAPEEIAAAVERLVLGPGLGERLARTGRERVRTRFTRRSTAQAFSRLFGSLLVETGRARARRT
jgi:glycosyltransferase involved in cell wall biosynthesis